MANPLLNYSKSQIDNYTKELQIVGSLSNLYSDSSAPMIYYRSTENIYCRAFHGTNISRTDCTADAIFEQDVRTGVGIKTFLFKPHGSFQKIAEFNKSSFDYKNLKGIELITKIARLRNQRIDSTMATYGLKKMIYHCILRDENSDIRLIEEPMHKIDILNIKILDEDKSKIVFSDNIERYSFYYSKSTLFKFFENKPEFKKFHVTILKEPMDILNKIIAINEHIQQPDIVEKTLILPLFSYSKTKGSFVPPKSGLNQWNANGRLRHEDEVYIPYNKKIREKDPDFFPPRKQEFIAYQPDGKELTLSVCQQDGKAIMSKHNKDLGHWILRDVLRLKPHEIVTYQTLLSLNINAIKFTKKDNGTYYFDFTFIDSQVENPYED